MATKSVRATLRMCGSALLTLAAISALLRVLLAIFLVYSFVLGHTAPIEWVQRWIPKMDRYSLDLVAILTPVLLLFLCFWDCVTMAAGAHLIRLEGYLFGRLAILPALLPVFTPCVVLGLPFAWVAHRILKNPSSRECFSH